MVVAAAMSASSRHEFDRCALRWRMVTSARSENHLRYPQHLRLIASSLRCDPAFLQGTPHSRLLGQGPRHRRRTTGPLALALGAVEPAAHPMNIECEFHVACTLEQPHMIFIVFGLSSFIMTSLIIDGFHERSV